MTAHLYSSNDMGFYVSIVVFKFQSHVDYRHLQITLETCQKKCRKSYKFNREQVLQIKPVTIVFNIIKSSRSL